VTFAGAKEGSALRDPFVAEGVFHGFIAGALLRFTPGPCNPDLNGAACWSLVAQAPGQKGAFVTDSSEPRRVDTKPLTTDVPLPGWGARQGIGLSRRGDPCQTPYRSTPHADMVDVASFMTEGT